MTPEPELTEEQKRIMNWAYHRLIEIDFHVGAPARAECINIIRSLRQALIDDEKIIKLINVSNIGLTPSTIRRYLKQEAEQSDNFMDLKDALGEPFTFRRPPPLELPPPDKKRDK